MMYSLVVCVLMAMTLPNVYGQCTCDSGGGARGGARGGAGGGTPKFNFQLAPPYTGNPIASSVPNPRGGRTDTVGYQYNPGKVTLTQTYDNKGVSKPIVVGAGLDFKSDGGHGVSGGLSITPGQGGSGNLRGQINIVDNPSFKVDAFAQHSRTLDRDLKPIGRETNSGGISIADKGTGASGTITTSQTHGNPASTNIGASIPLYKNDNIQVKLNGGATVGHDTKSQGNVKLEVSGSF